MRKELFNSLLITLLFSLTLGFTSCNSCGSGYEIPEKGIDTTEVIAKSVAINVGNAIAMDREAMYIIAGNDSDVRWFETTIMMDKMMTAPDCDGSAKQVVNTFQKIVKKAGGYDTMVYYFTHNNDGTHDVDSVSGWIEGNYPLNDELIKINYNEAYTLLTQANIAKPESRYCVLRKPVGPNECGVQWIFGNIKSQVYVDAVTGEVRATSPAYGELAKPLGEWP